MHKLLYILLQCCFVLTAHAQEPQPYEYSDTSLLNEGPVVDPPAVVEEEVSGENVEDIQDFATDTTLYIRELFISPDSIKAWKAHKDFAWNAKLDSLLRALKEKDSEEEESEDIDSPNFNTSFQIPKILTMLLWTLAIGVVVYVLYRLFLSNAVFRKETSARSTVAEISDENAVKDSADHLSQIRMAEEVGDYRKAVRHHFLHLLDQLAAKGKLQLSPNKTNYQYLKELPATYQTEFADIMHHYEYIWYGNTGIEQTQYNRIARLFSDINQKR